MKVFIVAEAGVNHNGEISIAKRLIDAAHESGADAIKFQTFKAERLVTKSAAMARYQAENSRGSESQYTMLKRLELSPLEQGELYDHCGKKGIQFMSTPFDEESADVLDGLGMEIFKVPSGELTNKGLLQHIARKKKPIFLSTGMSSLYDIDRALGWIRDAAEEGGPRVTLLHCVSNYPSRVEDVNLAAIRSMGAAFGVDVGYSDHTLGTEVAIAASAMGAKVIEKHFTLDRHMRGPDHKASLEPKDFGRMTSAIRNVELAMGVAVRLICDREREIQASTRRSLVTARAISKYEVLKPEDLVIKRPGTGIAPEFLEVIAGMRLKRDLEADTVLRWEDLKDA